MAKFRKLFQGLCQTPAFLITKTAAKKSQPAPDELTIEPPHRSPTSYHQLHSSPTLECWNPVLETGSLRVINPSRRSSSSASSAPSPPTRSPPPPPPSLPELFEGDDITPESFELQVTDEQEDREPEEALFTYTPRPSSRLEMRLEGLSPLDGSLFPPVITFQDSPFPIITIQEANAARGRSAPRPMHPLSQSQEIFPTPPLEERLTRRHQRVVESIHSTENLEMATTPSSEKQWIPVLDCNKPLPPVPSDETQMILRRIFAPAAEEVRQAPQLKNTVEYGKDESASLNTPTISLDYQPPTPPIWHSYATPPSAHIPLGLGIDLGISSSSSSSSTSSHSSQLSAFWTGTSRATGSSSYISFQRQSLRWQARTPTLNYNGRTSRFDRDYFTHRADKRKRFLEEDWEEWVRQLILAKTLARRITLMLDNLGEFSVDFDRLISG